MKKLLNCCLLLTLSLCLSCATSAQENNQEVSADFETDPVPGKGDAADDSFIIHHADSAPMIIGTDKKGGLMLFDHEGKALQFFAIGKCNNIDGAHFLGRPLVATTNVTQKSVQAYRLNKKMELVRLFEIPLNVGDSKAYGIAVSVQAGKLFIATSIKSGLVLVYAIESGDQDKDKDKDDERFSWRLHKQFLAPGTVEGMVFDGEQLYFSQEDRGIWRMELFQDREPQLMAAVGTPYLMPDVEGLAIYRRAQRHLLLASSQGNNSYAVFDLSQNAAPLLSFHIGDGTVDGTSITDGIEASSVAWGERFPMGVFIAQDNDNINADGELKHQNFKIVDWRKIEALLP